VALAGRICCRSNRDQLSAVLPSFAAIRICYGLALTDKSRRRDQILARGVETRSYGPVVTERSWIG
jgi:hypothetical protein